MTAALRNTRWTIVTATALAISATGCGDNRGEPIPSDRAAALIEQLDLVVERSEAGTCSSADFQINQLEAKTKALPANVDPDVRQELTDGLVQLRSLVSTECARQGAEATGQSDATETTDTTEQTEETTEATDPQSTDETTGPDGGTDTGTTTPDATAGGQPAPDGGKGGKTKGTNR